jgi:hypothetical protein
MQRGRSAPSLGDRAAASGVAAGGAGGTPGPARSRDVGEGRHCWVRDPPETPGTWPGLLVEWRQRAGVWQGRVAYTVAGPHGASLVEAWLLADRLEPR